MRALLLALSACGGLPPLDPSAPVPASTLAGTVVWAGEGEPGPVFLLLFAADDPPPPAGTGSPRGFASVPAAAFGPAQAGLRSAPFSLTGVADGDWILTALSDRDGDFQPLLSSNAGATCGDAAGAMITSLADPSPAVLRVDGPAHHGGLTVLVGTTVRLERPAFSLDPTVVARTTAPPQGFLLRATGVDSTLVRLPGPYAGPPADALGSCETFFLLHAVDADGDGAPDPHWNPAFAAVPGAAAIWPRVYLEYLGDGARALAPGERVVSEALVSPALLLDGTLPVGQPIPATELPLVFVPGARAIAADGTEAVLTGADVPAGSWAITVVAETGQTWTLPNETAEAPAASPAFDPAEQGRFLVVE